MNNVRHIFPYVYVAFFVPLLAGQETFLLAGLAGIYLLICLLIKPPVVRFAAPLLLASFVTLTILTGIVQGAACSSAAMSPVESIWGCIWRETAVVVSRVALVTSVLLLVLSNEWRQSLLSSVNGLRLPRQVRMIAALGIVMAGDFRKALSRVHQAFTARGDAGPGFSWRNAIALPSMLATAWASVLNIMSERMQNQWASEIFWESVIPRNPADSLQGYRSPTHDLVICALATAVLTATLVSAI